MIITRINADLRCLLKVAAIGLVFLVISAQAEAQEPRRAMLRVAGAEQELHTNILAHTAGINLTCDAPRTRINAIIPRLSRQVTRAARALGFYDLQESIRIERDLDTDIEACWVISIDVEPGPRITVASVSVTVVQNQQYFSKELDGLSMQAGDALNQESFERIKGQLNSIAVEQGFFDAQITESRLALDLENNTADAIVVFDPGARFRIRSVILEGHEVLDADYINSYLDVQPGDYYSAESILSVRNSLNESLYFNRVSVSPLHEEVDSNEIPLAIDLQMRPRSVFSFGGGATTDIGPRFRSSYENLYLNAKGHQFGVDASLSTIQQKIDLGYEIPLANPRTQRLAFSLGHLSEDVDVYESQTEKLGVDYSFIDQSGWRRNYFVNYQQDRFQLNEQSRESTNLLVPGIRLTRTQANDTLYPSRGWHFYAQLSGAHESLLSSTSFLQLNITAKTLFEFGPGRLILRGDLGSTVVDDRLGLPVNLQYFAGGDQSIRGYSYQSLGPINEAGDTIGGKHQIIGSVEYDFGIRPDWKLAVFTDVGNAFNDFSEIEFKQSVGVGIRWLSPVGPIRLDLASALDDDNKLRLHLSMGPDL